MGIKDKTKMKRAVASYAETLAIRPTQPDAGSTAKPLRKVVVRAGKETVLDFEKGPPQPGTPGLKHQTLRRLKNKRPI